MSVRVRWSPEFYLAAVGLVMIAGLETYALYRGVDGVMFGAAAATLGAIVGWVFKGVRRRKE